MWARFAWHLLIYVGLATLVGANDPQCANGIPVNNPPSFGDACCAKECGSCNFTVCTGTLPMDRCCGGLIARKGISCDDAEPPCIVTTPPKPSVKEGTCAYYYELYGMLLPGFSGGSAAERQEWIDSLLAVRKACQSGFNSSIYDNKALTWTQTTYVQPQMHPWDRYFYLPEEGYTVDKYLDDLKARYGGVDSILLWPVYPQLGVDNRNQFEMYDAMPGGRAQLKEVVAQLHARGVKVLYPYTPWDTSTARLSISDEEALAELFVATNAEGFNADTMSFVKESFFQAKPDAGKIAIEPERYGTTEMAEYHTLGWGQDWRFKDNAVPQVDFYKFALDARWMTNGVSRWSKNHTQYIQMALFNGIGFESWENVWGCWNEIVPRDGELLRRVATIERYFGGLGFLTSQSWMPFSESISSDVVYGSSFPLGSDTLYVLVNMVGRTADATVKASSSGKYFDCYKGTPLEPSKGQDGTVSVSVSVESLGIGCVLVANAESPELTTFLKTMQGLTQKPLSDFSAEWNFLMQTMVSPGTGSNSTEMVEIPGGKYHFVVSGVEREGNSEQGVDVQFPWEAHPQKEHDHEMTLPTFYIDKYPVANADYANYLADTGYSPTNTYHWLANWDHSSGKPVAPASISKQPVTYVGLAEARAYCSWRGARLPHSYEWQYAAQGTDGRLYPWGNSSCASCYPTPEGGHDNPIPADVDAHPTGASPFGVEDLVGNIWQYTDEFQDAHDRAVLVRGSSRYTPSAFGGSRWYFPAALELNLHGKYFLMDNSFERAATIGFRCAADASTSAIFI